VPGSPHVAMLVQKETFIGEWTGKHKKSSQSRGELVVDLKV